MELILINWHHPSKSVRILTIKLFAPLYKELLNFLSNHFDDDDDSGGGDDVDNENMKFDLKKCPSFILWVCEVRILS